MQKPLYGILLMYGRNRPGIAAAASRFISSNGANFVEENAQVLDGEFFCVMSKFKALKEDMEKIIRDCGHVLSGYDARVFPTNEPIVPKRKYTLLYDLHVIAEDETCIAATIEGIAARRGIDMKEVRGKIVKSPNSIDDIYYGTFRCECSNSRSVNKLQEDLKTLETEKGWELVLKEQAMPWRLNESIHNSLIRTARPRLMTSSRNSRRYMRPAQVLRAKKNSQLEF